MLSFLFDKLDLMIFTLPSLYLNVIIFLIVFIPALTEFLRKRIKFSGMSVAIILGFGVFRGLKTAGFFLFLFYYLFCILTERICNLFYTDSDRNKFGEIEQKSNGRDYSQVIANGILAFVCSVLYYVTSLNYFIVLFGAVLCESLSDSVASAVGKLSRNKPISIITRLPVEKGISGGFTILGFCGSSVSAALFSILWMLVFPMGQQMYFSLVVFVSGVSGCLIDSVLGGSVQVMYEDEQTKRITEKPFNEFKHPNRYIRGIKWMNNDAVNFFSNLFAFLFSGLLLSVL